MRMQQEFTVAEPVSAVWKFFDEPEAVAGCLPGVEQVTVLDADNVQVRATQSLGPMTATFEAKVTVLERVTEELIRFRATGRSVRGAIGNLRTENTVRLRAVADGTSVVVDGDLVLAGALGSVGQKVVSRQAAKVTAEFAANLQRALNGESAAPAGRDGVFHPAQPALPAQPAQPAQPAAAGQGRATRWPGARPDDRAAAAGPSGDRWGKAAVALSGASVLLSVFILIRQRRGQ
jgi:carbon monoxide dehydrogenase subunit G